MDKETLMRAKKLEIEIAETEKMIDALKVPCSNCIIAHRYNGSDSHSFSSNDELTKLLVNYFEGTLDKLRKEFEEL